MLEPELRHPSLRSPYIGGPSPQSRRLSLHQIISTHGSSCTWLFSCFRSRGWCWEIIQLQTRSSWLTEVVFGGLWVAELWGNFLYWSILFVNNICIYIHGSVDFTDMNMDTGILHGQYPRILSELLKFTDMDTDMVNFHGSYPWRALPEAEVSAPPPWKHSYFH